jgi:hypothetical protein
MRYCGITQFLITSHKQIIMKRIFLVTLAIFFAHIVSACDMCGGGAGSQYIGLLPGLNRNFVGVQFLTGNFTSRFPSIYHLKPRPDDVINDSYNTIQIWGRHSIGKKYQIFAFLPYQYNVRYINGSRVFHAGIGDITILLNRTILNREIAGRHHTMFGGVGINLPTGGTTSFDNNAQSQFPSMKPGTGTYDFMLNANYTIQSNKFGFNLDPSIVLTTASSDGYKFGNRFSVGAVAFYKLSKAKFLITPQAGIKYEYATQDYYNYKQNWANIYSGGGILFSSMGLQIAYRSLGLRFIGNLPLAQHYANGRINANSKLETGFFVTF